MRDTCKVDHFPRKLRPGQVAFWLLISLALSVTAISTIDPKKMQHLMQTRYGNEGVALLNAWDGMLAEAATATTDKQLTLVNQFFNHHIQYVDDLILWKKSDYWATPLELMGARAGDCEDFTIAKYLSLLELGIPVEQLRLIYVKAQIGGPKSALFQAHMVLGYYATPNSIPMIMDSLVDSIEPANQRSDLRPVFSFNSQGLWVGNRQTEADPTARLSRWRDLLTRIQAEGITLPSSSTLDTSLVSQ